MILCFPWGMSYIRLLWEEKPAQTRQVHCIMFGFSSVGYPDYCVPQQARIQCLLTIEITQIYAVIGNYRYSHGITSAPCLKTASQQSSGTPTCCARPSCGISAHDAGLPILLLFQEFFGKREGLSLQPCITRADVRRKAYARSIVPRVLPNTKEIRPYCFIYQVQNHLLQ